MTEKVDVVTRHLNVWASGAHHMLAKGFGWPDNDRCGVAIDAVVDVEALAARAEDSRALVWDLSRADDIYEASKRKYGAPGPVGYRSDGRSQLEGLVVECCLQQVGYPPLLCGLLLWLYPTFGDFVPARPSNWDPDNPYRSFRPKLWVAETCGAVVSKYGEQSVDRLLRQIEIGFRSQVADALRGASWERAQL